MIEFLLSCRNIDVNCQDSNGKTPLIILIAGKSIRRRVNLKVIEILLNNDQLNINLRDNKGISEDYFFNWSIIHYIAANKDFKKLSIYIQ